MANENEMNPEPAIQAFQEGHFAQAAALFQQLLTHQPDRPDYHICLAITYERLREPEKAMQAYHQALHLDPDNPRILSKYKRCAELSPHAAQAFNHLAIELARAHKLDSAQDCFHRAIDLAPHYAIAHNNLALLLKSQGRYDEALSHYYQAIELRPDYAHAQWNLALTLLLTGRYEKGWQKFQWRRQADLDAIPAYQCHSPPTWDGQPFRHQRLLIRCEQGMGDNIQFIRYLPLVKQLGGTVLVETPPPLLELFDQIQEIDELIEAKPDGECECDFDIDVFVMDLPSLFRTTLKQIPADIPYLYADIEKANLWQARMKQDKFNVGIVWAGSPKHANDLHRSCGLERFIPLTRLNGVQLYSLQLGSAHKELIKHKHCPIIDLAPELYNFADTAAVISQLDLVISVDTAVLHLAGALGKPAWALLPFVPDWRWLLDRDDSPWYPSLRLFRQSQPGQWHDMIEKIETLLSGV
jgi:Tfp pilus assembly protein PilF